MIEGAGPDALSRVIASVAANNHITVDELKEALAPRFLEEKLDKGIQSRDEVME